MKRGLLFIAGCLLAAGLTATTAGISYGLSDDQTENKTESRQKAGSGPIRVRNPCLIKLIHKTTLAAERPGIIDFVMPEEGETISKDFLAVGLRADVAKAALASATLKANNEIDVEFAKAQHKVSKLELEMAEAANLKVFDSVGRIELETLGLKKERSKLQIEQAELQIDIDELARQEAEANLKSFEIKAPWDGTVTRLYKRFRGEAVSQGEPILEMVNTDYVVVEAKVPFQDALRVKAGNLAEIRLNIQNVDLDIEKTIGKGRVIFVALTAKSLSNEILVKVKVKNPNNIFRENLTAFVTIYPDRQGPRFENE